MLSTDTRNNARNNARKTTANNTTDPLYRQVARELIADIEAGVYPVGHKVPSVRRLSKTREVSISTVSQAYSWLEDQGWLMARPQSGYYVRSCFSPVPREQVADALPPASQGEAPAEFTKAGLITDMLGQINRSSQINLGAAIPAPEVLPLRQLQTHINKVSRFHTAAVLDYQFSPGLEALRRQMAARMRDVGVRCLASDIIITNGCAEALTLCLRATMRAGDLLAVESPCYYGVLQVAGLLGLKIIEIPTDPQTGISVEALQLALEQWPVKMVAVNSRYSNPTGSVIPQDNQKMLLRLAEQYDIGIIEDDVYGELGYPGTAGDQPFNTVLKTFDRDGRVLYCSSFSKTLSAGLRVGWCIPGRWYRQVCEQQTFTTFSAPSLSQYAVSSYLQNGQYDRHLRQLRPKMAEYTRRMLDAVHRYFPPGTKVTEPRGGFILWLALPPPVDATELYHAAARQSVAIVPGGLFSNTGHFDHCIRINTSLPWNKDIDRALQTLATLTAKQLDNAS